MNSVYLRGFQEEIQTLDRIPTMAQKNKDYASEHDIVKKHIAKQKLCLCVWEGGVCICFCLAIEINQGLM